MEGSEEPKQARRKRKMMDAGWVALKPDVAETWEAPPPGIGYVRSAGEIVSVFWNDGTYSKLSSNYLLSETDCPEWYKTSLQVAHELNQADMALNRAYRMTDFKGQLYKCIVSLEERVRMLMEEAARGKFRPGQNSG
jgi:hypothetical protein